MQITNKNYLKKITSFEGTLSLLDDFIADKLRFYKGYRNQDLGDPSKNYVSGLSPAISRRIITEYEIVRQISKSFQYGSVDKFVDEICWRTYWKGWLEHRPAVWHDYLDDLTFLRVKYHKNEIFLRAVNGETGLECFDAWVNELKTHGYIHNHARMWFASIWVFFFDIPWQLGADFFYKNLLDADPASNTLSWRWVSGLQTKGKRYIATQNNIDRFTGNRFNFPKNFYVKEKEVIDNRVYEPEISIRYQNNSSNFKKGILIHEEDLSLSFVEKNIPIMMQSKTHNPYNQTSLPINLANRSIENSIDRCKKNFGSNNVSTFDWSNPQKLTKWISDHNLEMIEVTAPTVGKFENLVPNTLKNMNIEISYKYHDWDLSFWRFSDRGFFKLKKQIKKIVAPYWNGPLFTGV